MALPPSATTTPPPVLRAVCWGTRGSVPAPGPDTVRYGGNTSCLEVRAPGGRVLVFDVGTGIRGLGRRLEAARGALDVDVFLSHFHWDHIQGFPFWRHLYLPESRIRVHGPRQGALGAEQMLAGQMQPAYFPVGIAQLAAHVEYGDVNGTPWTRDGVEVASLGVRHSGATVGFRVRAGGAALAYVPDNELAPDQEAGSAWYRELVGFLRGVDVLFHDAMLTEAEYRGHFRGWGHSTFPQAVRLAEDAEVRRLFLFHHFPDRTDAQLDEVAARLRDELAARGSPLQVAVACEGEEVAA
ncbi:MAG TPA: MBL fold metallo-hydrolase [Longimicrobiaceae bacterium]|nr:MBL fold metallo-hydrolase [Longimicrobiaceae bacterium]